MKTTKTMTQWTLILLILFSVMLLHGTMYAATFCVSTAVELHSTLGTATSNGEDDIVQIVQGTYEGNFVYASTEAFNLTVEGGYVAGCASRVVDPANTVLDGMGTGNVLVLSSPDVEADFLVDGLTLQNGSVNDEIGGGLFASLGGGKVTLINNTITGNTAGVSASVSSSTGSITVTLT